MIQLKRWMWEKVFTGVFCVLKVVEIQCCVSAGFNLSHSSLRMGQVNTPLLYFEWNLPILNVVWQTFESPKPHNLNNVFNFKISVLLLCTVFLCSTCASKEKWQHLTFSVFYGGTFMQTIFTASQKNKMLPSFWESGWMLKDKTF